MTPSHTRLTRVELEENLQFGVEFVGEVVRLLLLLLALHFALLRVGDEVVDQRLAIPSEREKEQPVSISNT